MKENIRIAGLVIALGLTLSANADVIAGYSISTNQTDGGLSADTLAADVSATDLSSPSWTLAIANDEFINIPESAGMQDGTSDNMAAAWASGQYIEFTLNTTSTETFVLDELQMTLERSSRGPQDFGVRVSTNNFSTYIDLGTYNQAVTTTAELETVDLSGLLFDASADLTFRIAYDDRVHNSASSSAGRFYDIAVTGSIPEPAVLSFIGLSGFMTIVVRRFKRG